MKALNLPYVGSKAAKAKDILPYFPSHTTYVELFFGGGNMFFAKQAAGMRAKHNILNDIDRLCTNFFWCCQHAQDELLRVWSCMPIADDVFSAAKLRAKRGLPVSPTTREQVQYAADWLYVSAFSLYGMRGTIRAQINTSELHGINKRKIQGIADALRNCTILNREANDVIGMLGAPRDEDYATVFTYCDPPYINTTQPYAAASWNAESLHSLIAALETKAKFGMKYAISEYDSPLICEIAAKYGLQVHTVGTTVSMGKKANTDVLLLNYSPTHKLF